MWETIFTHEKLSIESRYYKPLGQPLGSMEYRVVSTDDTTGEQVTMSVTAHEVINILTESR